MGTHFVDIQTWWKSMVILCIVRVGYIRTPGEVPPTEVFHSEFMKKWWGERSSILFRNAILVNFQGRTVKPLQSWCPEPAGRNSFGPQFLVHIDIIETLKCSNFEVDLDLSVGLTLAAQLQCQEWCANLRGFVGKSQWDVSELGSCCRYVYSYIDNYIISILASYIYIYTQTDLLIGTGTIIFRYSRHKLSPNSVEVWVISLVGVLGILGESIGHLSINYSGGGEGWPKLVFSQCRIVFLPQSWKWKILTLFPGPHFPFPWVNRGRVDFFPCQT